jgi:hypothetical protein
MIVRKIADWDIIQVLLGRRMLLNPLAWISAKIMGWTGGLFQEPSVGIASRVLPRFHPGFSPANAALAVIGMKGVVQTFVADGDAMLD